MMHLKSTRENKVKFIHDYVSHNTARNRVSIKNENQLDANILNFSVIFLWCSANPARSFSTRAQKRFSILNSASNGQIPHLDIIAKHDKYFKQDHDSGRGMLLDRSYSTKLSLHQVCTKMKIKRLHWDVMVAKFG